MKISELASLLDLEAVVVSDSEREVKGVYSGDLLSWVMTRLSCDYAWITIMNNVNIVAVASLSDASCIIVSENADISQDVAEKAKQESVNIYRTSMSSFDIAYSLGKVLYEK